MDCRIPLTLFVVGFCMLPLTVVVITEMAVVIITGAARRVKVYRTNHCIIDRIRHHVPIWKCGHFADGKRFNVE